MALSCTQQDETESYPVAQFPTESALWQHLEPAISRLNNGDARPIPMAPTMGDLVRRYQTEYLIKLSKSTQVRQRPPSMFTFSARWGKCGSLSTSDREKLKAGLRR